MTNDTTPTDAEIDSFTVEYWGCQNCISHAAQREYARAVLARQRERTAVTEDALHERSLDYAQTLDLQSFRVGWREAETYFTIQPTKGQTNE